MLALIGQCYARYIVRVVLVRGVSRGVNHVRVGDHVWVPPPPLDRHSVSYILSLRNVHVILAPTLVSAGGPYEGGVVQRAQSAGFLGAVFDGQ